MMRAVLLWGGSSRGDRAPQSCIRRAMRGKQMRTVGTMKPETRKARSTLAALPTASKGTPVVDIECQTSHLPHGSIVAIAPAGTPIPRPMTQARGIAHLCIRVFRVLTSPVSVE